MVVKDIMRCVLEVPVACEQSVSFACTPTGGGAAIVGHCSGRRRRAAAPGAWRSSKATTRLLPGSCNLGYCGAPSLNVSAASESRTLCF